MERDSRVLRTRESQSTRRVECGAGDLGRARALTGPRAEDCSASALMRDGRYGLRTPLISVRDKTVRSTISPPLTSFAVERRAHLQRRICGGGNGCGLLRVVCAHRCAGVTSRMHAYTLTRHAGHRSRYAHAGSTRLVSCCYFARIAGHRSHA